jgi:long-chain acyl-CoA synthetase
MHRQSIIDLFQSAIAAHDKPNALMFKRNGCFQSLSSKDVHLRVKQASAGLFRLGIRKGDRLGILSENRPEWAIADLAMLANGAVNVPIYSALPARQIQYLMQHAEIRLIFVSDRLQLDKVLQVRRDVPSLEKIVLFNEVGGLEETAILFHELLRIGQDVLTNQPSTYEELCSRIKPEDLASIIYTSGTTGTPKGVMLSHWNIVSNVLSCGEIFHIDSQDVVLTFLPLCHIFERMADYLMIFRGATVAYAESPETVPQNMLEVRPTIVPGVPRLFEKMYLRMMEAVNSSSPLKRRLMRWAMGVGRNHSRKILARETPSLVLGFKNYLASKLVFSELQQKLGGRLRFFISGGAPLEKELAEFFYGLGVLILEGYGLTETSPVIAVNQPNRFKLGSVGEPVKGVEVKIAEDGEILTRGASVMQGYYLMEEETRKAFEGGWFHTGDIGFLDHEGFLYVTDRKKDLIVTASGKNVAPQKIEGALKKCPYLLNTVVIGDRRPYVAALVVPDPDKLLEHARKQGIASMDYSELLRTQEVYRFLMEQIESCLANFAPYERVRRIALIEKDFSIDAGDLTPSLKVRRRVVESEYHDVIETLYAPTYQPA